MPDDHGLPSLACRALAFRIFLFMVPLAYIAFTVLGTASTAVTQDPAQVTRDSDRWRKRGAQVAAKSMLCRPSCVGGLRVIHSPMRAGMAVVLRPG